MHGNRVRFKVSLDTSFNFAAYIVYKWQGRGHHKMNIPRKMSINPWQCLIILRWTSAVDRTIKTRLRTSTSLLGFLLYKYWSFPPIGLSSLLVFFPFWSHSHVGLFSSWVYLPHWSFSIFFPLTGLSFWSLCLIGLSSVLVFVLYWVNLIIFLFGPSPRFSFLI